MITKEWLQQFCAPADSSYSLTKPYLFTHPTTGKEYTFATDGHHMVIVDGHVEDCEADPKAPNIKQFVVEPGGVDVDAAKLKAFLECDKPSTETLTCKNEDCRDGEVSCECPTCGDEHYRRCGECKGTPKRTIRLVRRGWLGECTLNCALLADLIADVADDTVRVLLAGQEAVIHVFASDRHACVMPMRYYDDDFKDAPRFAIESPSAEAATATDPAGGNAT